ncbi:MAG: helix-hairpin-helix domain-containing protein, partial [Maribacter sp.]
QVVFYVVKYKSNNVAGNLSLDKETQEKIDALKDESQVGDPIQIFTFNPNYISDYKGYTLGLTLEEIDRLHAFRAENKFVNNSEEFQKITHVSDSLLNVISPYFKFPEWATTKSVGQRKIPSASFQRELDSLKDNFQIKDLNSATAEDFKSVSGIGQVLALRIIKFRNRLGGFMVDDQLYDVYGLAPDVVKRTFERFKVMSQPQIEKININSASADEISELIYLRYNVATRIVEYRAVNGSFSSFDELTKIEDFPIDKIHRIKLYLSL